MSVYIKGMEMPRGCASCKISRRNGKKMICPFIWKCEWDIHDPMSADHRLDGCPLVPVPNHGRLIDADALRQAMYHEAFETDSPMQKWDSGCWIRYKMFERMEESAPTIIPADEDECKMCANADNEYGFTCDNGNQFKPQTNADRIRQMTDEELARWIATTADDNCPDTAHERYCDNRCGECWLDWLEKE